MRKLGLLVAILIALTSSGALAQAQTQFLSIPSSGFTPRESEALGGESYSGNISGTARRFAKSIEMFAPVNLPDGATVTSLRCGGSESSPDLRIRFRLRRNEPQQANVDMATVHTGVPGTGFQFRTTTSITQPVVTNSTFNYYIIADLESLTSEFPQCPLCSVGFCQIGYTIE